jgi:gamma-glutamyl:cysteine ligase YbdK (ATP-grasp superfamily)
MARDIEYGEFTEQDYQRFGDRLKACLTALGHVLQRDGFGHGATTLGAELELALIDEHARAAPINRAVLSDLTDPRLTVEIDRFNLEYNLTPVAAAGSPFAAMERELSRALSAVDRAAAAHGGRIVPVGILPTLTMPELESSALTDLPRYRALSRGLRHDRRGPFAIHIDGADPLSLIADDITLEGANTSFQVHLRVDPCRFADSYNAAQIATPLVLALGANSPTFLGHRLWDETRIALFKQSLDVRDPSEHPWRAPARVGFGHGWVRHGAWELFAESAALFPPILPVVCDEDPLDVVRSGGIPGLRELRLHHGTVWRWNRAIYDAGEGGHLRIEMRALPAGPTPLDMAANAAFLIGLTTAWRERAAETLPRLPFLYAEWNFYRAAQHGLDARLIWPFASGHAPSERPVTELVEPALADAAEGLAQLGVERSDADRMLGVIRARLATRRTGARWQRRAFDTLVRRMPRAEALARLVDVYVANSRSERPVHEWQDVDS